MPHFFFFLTCAIGIGKSQFAYYCLWQQSKVRKSQVVIYQWKDDFYRFSENSVVTGSPEAFRLAGYFSDEVCAITIDSYIYRYIRIGCEVMQQHTSVV
jgi:hypothetical protein